MDGHRDPLRAQARILPPTNVRVLRSDEELTEAIARAEDGASRLRDRLAARAARDAWMVEHAEQRLGWRRFVRAHEEGLSRPPTPSAGRSSPLVAGVKPTSRSPAA
ncbi:MAG: hypothetical protein M0Z46_15440 [Actinomycetota bacterium]|jgi:hypothetical protein|nr:hypothetical protein [Actinomycetota bacterium]